MPRSSFDSGGKNTQSRRPYSKCFSVDFFRSGADKIRSQFDSSLFRRVLFTMRCEQSKPWRVRVVLHNGMLVDTHFGGPPKTNFTPHLSGTLANPKTS
jgi:hypothetical protein